MNTTYTIEISEVVTSPAEVSTMLQQIANMIDEGYQSGYAPNWKIVRHEL